ncbi:MAG: FAD-dependent thymidylate synthase [Elusimicrobia bacterium]|nr:FAD-dependent thymidylate synthase [Elusimicrobiota bacterium]
MITAEERKPERFYSVLDKGFVRLVDFMGGDRRAVESARVTFGSRSKGEEKDKKLVEYLLSHGHHTPFEHSVFQFHIKCPIFVARQWMRHRIACVAGDTKLYFDLPAGPRAGNWRAYRMTVEEFFRKWESGAKPIPHSKNRSTSIVMPQRKRLKGMMLRQLKEDTWTLGHTRVLDVFKTGEKPVFEVLLEDGKAIRCTKDHRFRFEDGWKTLEAATGLRLRGETAAYRAQLPRMAANGRIVANPLYRDKEWLKTQYRQTGADDVSVAKLLGVSGEVIRKWRRIHGLINIKPGGFRPGMSPWNKGTTYQKVRLYQKVEKPKPAIHHLIPRWIRISSIKYLGIRPTYDLSVEGPFHNYVADGVVTHNSYNEVSARYTEVREEFYVPSEFRAQDRINRQGSTAGPGLDQSKMPAIYEDSVKASYRAYRKLLKAGAARELARMALPVAQYTQFHWTINARSLMNFITLRMDAHAQLEIRVYAKAIAEIFKAEMPWTWEAYSKHAAKKPTDL